MNLNKALVYGTMLVLLGSGCSEDDVNIDIINKLNELDGVTITELSNSSSNRRRFQIDMEQPLDHNNPNGPVFIQRLYLHHLDEEQPVLFAPNGYSTEAEDEMGGELISMLQANLITSTHRYWPGSEPVGSDLQYLTIAQAAADHHEIISKFKDIYRGIWLSAGVSKGGMTALYHKRFYPDDVQATVVFGAPFKFGLADERYPQFLETIGTSQQRQIVYDFQRMALERRETLIPMFENWFPRNGYTLAHDPDESFESAVIGFQPEFWEKHTVNELDQIPSNNASDQEILDYLHQIENFIGYSELGIDIGTPYFYQAFTEEGLEANSTNHFSDLLITNQIDILALFNSILGINPVYDPSVIDDIYNWVINSGNNIIFIYGGNDPWTAGAVELNGTTNAIKIINPGDNHSVFINELPASDRNLVISTLEQWLNLEIE